MEIGHLTLYVVSNFLRFIILQEVEAKLDRILISFPYHTPASGYILLMSSFHVLYLYHICTQNTDPTTVHLNLSFRNLPVCRISDPSSKSSCIACSERLTLSRALRNSPLVGSEPAIFRLILFPSILMSPADHAPSPAVLCRRAAPGHSCLSSALPACMSSLCPRSAAQISSRGCHFFLPTHLP